MAKFYHENYFLFKLFIKNMHSQETKIPLHEILTYTWRNYIRLYPITTGVQVNMSNLTSISHIIVSVYFTSYVNFYIASKHVSDRNRKLPGLLSSYKTVLGLSNFCCTQLRQSNGSLNIVSELFIIESKIKQLNGHIHCGVLYCIRMHGIVV